MLDEVGQREAIRTAMGEIAMDGRAEARVVGASGIECARLDRGTGGVFRYGGAPEATGSATCEPVFASGRSDVVGLQDGAEELAAADALLDSRLATAEAAIAALESADADLQAQIDALPLGTRWYDDVVFSGQASNLWTTLDLGPWTESRRALVVLRGGSRPPYGYILAYFRPLGLTTTPLDDSGQLNTAYESEDYVIVETDDLGRIEWLEVNSMQLELRVRAVIL